MRTLKSFLLILIIASGLHQTTLIGEVFGQVIEAEDMEIKTAGAPINNGWLLDINGYISSTIDFAQNGFYSFKVRARGRKAYNEWPFMELRIDNLVCGPLVIDYSSWQYYTITSKVTAGSHQIILGYINDRGSRGLYLDKVIISPTEINNEQWLIRLSDSILSKNPNPGDLLITDWQLEELMYGMAKAYEITGDEKYINFVRNGLDNHVDKNGNLDLVVNGTIPGIMLIWLYQATGDAKYLTAAINVAEYLLNEYPRTADGGFVHLAHLKDQLWVDTLGGLGRFLAMMGHITGNQRYFNEGANQIIIHALRLQDVSSGLFYHGWDEDGSADWSTPPNNCSPCFWARGNGWVIRCMADFLKYLPQDHFQRKAVLAIFQNLIDGVVQYQDVVSGLWFTVLDRVGDAGNYLETSGSALLAYGIQKGINLGCVNSAYQTYVDRANNGLYRKLYLKNDNEVIVTGISAGTAPGEYNYYVARQIRTGDDYPYGDGVLLQEKSAIVSNSNLSKFIISGYTLYYSNNNPIRDVSLTITDGVLGVKQTDLSGYYEHQNLPAYLNYIITTSKQTDIDIGNFIITTYDAALTAQAAVGMRTLTNYESIAADVNKDGKIYTFDAALIAQYAVGLPNISNSHVGEWDFVPESRYYQSLNSNEESQNYAGIILGNVHGGWSQPNSLKKQKVSYSKYDKLKDIFTKPGGEVIIPIAVDDADDILSADIDFTYDSEVLQFLEITKTYISRNCELIFNNESGRLRIGIFNINPIAESGILINLKFKTINRAKVKYSYLSLDRYQLNNSIFMQAKSQLIIGEASEESLKFTMAQNYPNPFKIGSGSALGRNRQTLIKYQLSRQEKIELKIYNFLGQEVNTLVNAQKSPGTYQVYWDGRNNKGDYVSTGLYIYKLISNDKIIMKKMILLR